MSPWTSSAPPRGVRGGKHLRAIAAKRKAIGMTAAACNVAIGHERVRALRHHVIDLCARFAEHRLFARQILLERERRV